MDSIKDLIEISHFFGKNKEFVIAGGGNTSYKNEQSLWIKASGTTLADITENGFAVLDRNKLKVIAEKKYSDNSDQREREIKTDLFRCSLFPEMQLRPSVETSLHDLIHFSFVVHTHPTVVNALLCSVNAKKKTTELFPTDALYIEYTDPGYVLFKKVEIELSQYRKEKGKDPHVIFLENHGVFVAADSCDEIKKIYENIITVITRNIKKQPDLNVLPIDHTVTNILPAIRMIASENKEVKIVSIRYNILIDSFIENEQKAKKVSLTFTPDIIVYCKAYPIYIDKSTHEEVLIDFEKQYRDYLTRFGYAPKIVLIKGYGMVAMEDNIRSAEIALDVFEDLMKISFLSENFGGPHFMNEKEIAFIDNWEVENYRRQVSKGTAIRTRVENKVIVITGGAQGFGAGIAEHLFEQKANIVIADLNIQKGNELAQSLNEKGKNNKAICVKTDVCDENSIGELISQTVKTFGGLDVFISNAGILRAGGLEEMSLDSFELMTKVNYTAFFLCTKYAAQTMKLQSKYHSCSFADIIQINSKSGLKGSNKNFAYAGGKFGGVGLTQSFAMELIPFRIKVNAICPGNLLDGPLWSDPDKGLFVQYLKAGKVPGAKTVEDVKKYYQMQVPAKRGCQIEDVVKAILYVIEQQYETGQAIPVTGGQEMLH